MLFSLKVFLMHCGVLQAANVHFYKPKVLQLITNVFVITSMGFFCLSSVIYSLKYQDVFSFIKSAGYSYNNISTVCVTYVYLILTQSKLKSLIEAWEATILNRTLSFYFVLFAWRHNIFRFRNKKAMVNRTTLWKPKGTHPSNIPSNPFVGPLRFRGLLYFRRFSTSGISCNGQLRPEHMDRNLWPIYVGGKLFM